MWQLATTGDRGFFGAPDPHSTCRRRRTACRMTTAWTTVTRARCACAASKEIAALEHTCLPGQRSHARMRLGLALSHIDSADRTPCWSSKFPDDMDMVTCAASATAQSGLGGSQRSHSRPKSRGTSRSSEPPGSLHEQSFRGSSNPALRPSTSVRAHLGRASLRREWPT